MPCTRKTLVVVLAVSGRRRNVARLDCNSGRQIRRRAGEARVPPPLTFFFCYGRPCFGAEVAVRDVAALRLMVRSPWYYAETKGSCGNV